MKPLFTSQEHRSDTEVELSVFFKIYVDRPTNGPTYRPTKTNQQTAMRVHREVTPPILYGRTDGRSKDMRGWSEGLCCL